MTAGYRSPRRCSLRCPLVLCLSALACLLALFWVCAFAPWVSAALPDARAYELVSPPAEQATAPYAALASVSGERVDFQARGAFAGAGSGSLNLYQASRGANGWQTTPLTPTPSSPLGPLEEQVPLFYSPDLSQTIFTTPVSYASGDDDAGALDLYLRGPGGSLTWLSQGSEGGAAEDQVSFDGATPDAGAVVFSSAEALLPAATPLSAGLFPAPEYLYEREVGSGETELVDVSDDGELLSPEGAVLGNGTHLTAGAPPAAEYVPADLGGTTTNAISADGSRVFFESPPPSAPGRASLYVREDGSRTVLIAASQPVVEQQQPPEQVRFEGASATGSLVFYTSAGALYVYDTETQATATVAASVLGVSAIANDGSHVFFVSDSELAANSNPQGAVATEGAPNLYVYDTADATTTFIATLAASDVQAEGFGPARLVAEPDVDRPAVPSPDGSVLAFASFANLTGQNPAERYAEIYRYSIGEDSLVCVSCAPAGREPTGNATFGETAGGTYDPPGLSSPMNADGSEIFFDTPDSLAGEDTNQDAPADPLTGEPGSTDVYEWEGGGVHLISCGCSSTPATLMGSTPSGDDVLFMTAATLVPWESAGGYVALYDARVGGGFPPPPSDAPPSCPSGCRAAASELPPLATPPTATFQGPGNPPAAKPKPKPKPLVCRKGYVKRTVKLAHHKTKTVCVKRKKPARTSTRHRPKPR